MEEVPAFYAIWGSEVRKTSQKMILWNWNPVEVKRRGLEKHGIMKYIEYM